MARKRKKKSKARKKAREAQERSGADTMSPDDAEAATGAAPKADASEGADLAADESETKSGAASKSTGKSGSSSKGKSKGRSTSKSSSRSTSRAKAKSKDEAQDEAKLDGTTESDGEIGSKATSTAKDESGRADEAKAKPKAKSKAKAKPKAKPKRKAKSKAKSEPKAEAEAKSEPKAKSEPEAEAKSEPKPDSAGAVEEEAPVEGADPTPEPPPKSKRRRKKGKERTEEQPDEGESEAVEAESAPVEAEPEPLALDDTAGTPVDEVIAIDDDLDEPEAREALIAAVAGLNVDAPDEADMPTTTPPPEAEDLEDVLQDDTGVVSEEMAEDAEGPLITADALLALSEFRQEGVASIPGELVLDLGEATTEEERDRLLAAAMAHAEMQDAVYRVRADDGVTRRWKGVAAALVFLVALFTATLPPSFLTPEPPADITDADLEHGVRVALVVQARQVEAFRVREGRLPTALGEVAATLPGIRYVRSSNRLYQLVGYLPSGEAIVYDSAAPDPTFEPLMQRWLAAEVSS